MDLNPKTQCLLLLPLLAVIILFSGCTGLDPQVLATSNPVIQQFLNEHPNAQIKVTHFTAEQAKNMIDQIRKDCDNPFMDEKEFYRVNVSDPETDFYAVVWIDWNTKTVECVFKLGTEGKIIEKPRPANCTNHDYYTCYNSHVYWFDSCGDVQDKKEYCKQGCSGKECLGECKSRAEYRCYGDHVFWFDSCGNKQDKKEYCQYGCENGFCKTRPAEKTCEEMGGYCVQPRGYCGDGVCSVDEEQYACTEDCSGCPEDSDITDECAQKCARICKSACPQDCEVIPYPGGGGSEGEGQAICEKKCETLDIKFADFRADKEVYYTGEVVQFFAKLVDNNWNPATPEQVNRVYIFAILPTMGPTGSSIPINYNYSSGYYEFSTPPIPSNIEAGTWIFFATAENNESFATSGNAYVTIKLIDSAAQTALPSASPTRYEGCINKCLLRFRLADFSVIAPLAGGGGGASAPSTASATGMVVSVETTASTTTVSYQCRPGYQASRYFCKEGGICCIPQTPQPTEFCGSSTQGPCSSDSGCMTGGCSGQVCQSVKEEPVITTCEYRDCYNAEKYGMRCKCMIESVTPAATAAIIGDSSIQGRCKWEKSIACTEDAKICPGGTTVSRNPNRNCEFNPCPAKCGNGICESGEADYCPPCANSDPPCLAPCTAGTCPQDCQPACKDSDGGWNQYIRGTVATSSGISKTDSCAQCTGACEPGTQCPPVFCGAVVEYACKEGEIRQETFLCPNGCVEGACIKGGCIGEGQSLGAVVPDNYNYCCEGFTAISPSESDSGGQCKTLVGARGYCTKCGDGICKSPENSCNCPQDCKSTTTCTDSDGGKNYYQQGTATSGGQSLSDHCNDGGTLTEKYCSGSEIKAETYKCPYGCSNSACISPSSNCSSHYDQACPQWCSAGSDADCCADAGKYWLQTPSGFGCYDSNYNPGCASQSNCTDDPDQCCANWCSSGSDIDCCLQAGKCWINNGCYSCQ